MGDGMLVEFPSALEAVRAALEIQRAMADRPSPAGITFRVGINLGDIIVDEGDIFGDGVNVAARLEAEAPQGGLCIAGAVFEQVRDRIGLTFEDMGELALKNIDRPVRAWAWMPGREAAPEPSGESPALPDKPSIAVLAFENMSSDPEHDFFGDGLAEEIITTLSKISNLMVIARNSSFTYKGRAVDVRTVGHELGVRYVLEGSVRAAGPRIRVTAQLIDAQDGQHVWAERYDRQLEDIFAIQDEITREIVTALRIRLSDGEQAQLWLRGTGSVEAWAIAMPALELLMRAKPDAIRDALALLDRAIRVDPDYASAHAMIAQAHWFEVHFGFSDDTAQSLALFREAAERVLALDPNLAIGHQMAALMALESGDYDAARCAVDRAIALSPNNAMIRTGLARVLIDAGYPAEAEENIRYAMRLNPFYPVFYNGILANAVEQQGREAEAIAVLRPTVERNPDYFSGRLRLASLLAHAGQLDEARRHAIEARRINPRFGRDGLAAFYRSPEAARVARFIDGLEKAGMVRGIA